MPIADINGARLWYDVRGQGQPIIFHHGFTAGRENWEPAASRLVDAYQVILMECRGSGESEDTKDGYDLDQYAADVIGMADHLGLDRFTFAGHSMAGGIGFVLALNHAERLDRLILMAPIPSGGISAAPDPAMMEARMQARADGNRDYFLAELNAMKFREDAETDAWFETRVDQLMRVAQAHVMGGLETMTALNVTDRLGEIQTPTLMIAGTVDGLLPANLTDYQLLPDASLQVFSHAGHDVAVHEPEGVSDAIDKFMRYGVVTNEKLLARLQDG